MLRSLMALRLTLLIAMLLGVMGMTAILTLTAVPAHAKITAGNQCDDRTNTELYARDRNKRYVVSRYWVPGTEWRCTKVRHAKGKKSNFHFTKAIWWDGASGGKPDKIVDKTVRNARVASEAIVFKGYPKIKYKIYADVAPESNLPRIGVYLMSPAAP